MDISMLGLRRILAIWPAISRNVVPRKSKRYHTQLRLKQSWEQKELSISSFKHVGHCRDPASFGQSTPLHFLFSIAAGAMLECVLWFDTEATGRKLILGWCTVKVIQGCPHGRAYVSVVGLRLRLHAPARAVSSEAWTG